MSNGEFQFLLMPTAFYLPYRQQKLCDYVCDLLLEESNVQPVSSPVTVCGDIHGQVSVFKDITSCWWVENQQEVHALL